ncbi:MAG: glycerophosphodiester phosphodiesterase [Polyangiales bacterium]
MNEWRFSRRAGAPPLIYAHRGARAVTPENTMLAFERGVADGADGVELDVRTTRDGEVVVVHDVDLQRVTEGRDARAVADLTTRELTAIELPCNSRVPRLADVLDWADQSTMGRGILVNVELKHDTSDKALLARRVVRLLRGRARAASSVMLSSFDPELLARCAAIHPTVPRAFLFHEKQWFARTPCANWIASAVRAVALHPQRSLCTPARVNALHAAGWLVNVWTVNDPTEARALSTMGVDGIITDDPKSTFAATR